MRGLLNTFRTFRTSQSGTLERVEGAPPPLKDVDAWARPSLTHNGEPWRVCCRYLRDAKVHNEFGDERDYVEEEEVCFRRPYFMNRLRE